MEIFPLSCGQQWAFDEIIHLTGLVGALFAAVGGIYLGYEALGKKVSSLGANVIIWLPILVISPIAYCITIFCDLSTAESSSYQWSMGIIFLLGLLIFSIRFVIFDHLLSSDKEGSYVRYIAWSLVIFGFMLILSQQIIDTVVIFVKHYYGLIQNCS